MAVMTKSKVEEKSGLPCIWSWDKVPSYLNTKTQLKKLQLWREGINPVAAKGCVQESQGGYYLLYDIRKFKYNYSVLIYKDEQSGF